MKYILSEAHGIGDCILILPVAKAIKMYDKNAYVKVITRSDKNKIGINKSIMSLQNYVDEIDYYSSDEMFHSILFLLKNIFKRFDFGISIQDYDTKETSSYPSRILKLCAKKTCGTKIISNPSIKYDYYIDRKKGMKRDEYFYQALNRLGIRVVKNKSSLLNVEKIVASIPFNDIEQNRYTVAIVMGTAPVSLRTEKGMLSNDVKSWTTENWIKLANLIVNNDCNVLVLGGAKEKVDLHSSRASLLHNNIHDYVGKTTIKESIALPSLADIVVGADTGLMHCAGALDKPTLTLFGCTDPDEYLPFGEKGEYIKSGVSCSPCFGTLQSVKCEHKKCMSSITVEEVYSKVKKIMLKNSK